MKKLLQKFSIGMFFYLLLLIGIAKAQMVHPGVLLNKTELDNIKSKVLEGKEPWLSAYNAMKASSMASLSYTPKPWQVVECGSGSNPNYGCSDERGDMEAAFTHAMMWYITGNKAYADKAIEIMDAWSAELESHTNSNAGLQASWAGCTGPAAAEIIRYTYTGWPADKIARFENMLKNAVLPSVRINMSTKNGNWELISIEARMNMAVFLNDQTLFNEAVSMWKKRVPAYMYLKSDGPYPVPPANTSIDTPSEIIKYWQGQSNFVDGIGQETCRDFGHLFWGMNAASNAAETAYKQGVDLYSIEAERLIKAHEFHSAYSLGETPPSQLCGGSPNISTNGPFEAFYNHFHNRLGYDLPFTANLVNKSRPRSPNYFILWETLMFGQPIDLPKLPSFPAWGKLNLLPFVNFTSPSNNATLTGTVTVNAVAYDMDAGTANGSGIQDVVFQLLQGSTVVASGRDVSPAYNWSLNTGLFANGTYTLRVTATSTSTAGGTSSTKDFSITINNSNKAPVVSITSPANNANFTAPASITISANATDSDGSITKVDFYNGNTLLGTDNSSPYSFNWTNVAAGTYTLTAKGTDNRGSVTSSSAVTVNVTNAVNGCQTSSASGDQNQAGTVLDNNLNTWWSASGDGQWMQFCLDTLKNVSGTEKVNGVQMAFYNGNARIYTFDVLLSKDGQNWTTAAAGLKSSGTTLNMEDFNFTAASAKYVRIVGHSNTVNAWNAYTEIRVKTISANEPPVVSIATPTNNATFKTGDTVYVKADASDADGSIAKIDLYYGNTFVATEKIAPYEWHISGLAAGSYVLTAVATDNLGATTTSSAVNITVTNPVSQTPYGGTPWPIPGKVEAENYDTGGEGIAYHDATPGNSGNVYRTDDVDIQATGDTGGGYNTAWTSADEWLEYTVNVQKTSTYKFEIRAASTYTGKTLRIEMDGKDVTGTVTVPNTGAWQTYQTVTVNNVSLTAGQKVMRVYFITGSVNLNYVNVTDVGNTTQNQSPTVSISSPANNATYTSPATITISATAADTDGSISKVDFYNGSTLLGTDNSSPYSYSWSNVAAGTYTIKATATDNQGATKSTTVTVTVNASTNACANMPQYVENGGYAAGSKVQNAGGIYQCKPYPYSGWCNGSAWAYAPGTGSYWTDAWDKVGSCTAKMGSFNSMATTKVISIYPNPTTEVAQLKLNVSDIYGGDIQVTNSLGEEVYRGKLDSNLESTIDLKGLESGIYMIKISSEGNVWFEKLAKQ